MGSPGNVISRGQECKAQEDQVAHPTRVALADAHHPCIPQVGQAKERARKASKASMEELFAGNVKEAWRILKA